MGSRLELQYLLEDILGNENVYYNPPETLERQYPAIEYTKEDIDLKRASNSIHIMNDKYKVTVISKLPDNPAIKKLLELPMCSFDRGYTFDGLRHDVLDLYY